MGKYSEYAQRLDALARQRFADYEKAADTFKKAEKEKYETPMKTGWGVTPEYQMKAKKAEVNYLYAEKDYKKAKEIYLDTLKEAQNIRAELLEEVSKDYFVNPEDLDRNVVDLLQSGICSAEEIAGLFDKADNGTTKRYIAKFASEEVKRIDPKMEKSKSLRVQTILNNVAYAGRGYTNPANSEPMQRFDAANEVLTRCINNPAMHKYWGELTAETLSEL